MLLKNKISKYLLYAIGEIILVVIGILLAVQINTANQNRQRAKLEHVLLEQVKRELLSSYTDLRNDSEVLARGEISHYAIEDHIAQDLPYVDSLCFDFHWIKMDEYIYPAEAAYSRLKEEGLDIIKNDTIRLAIRGLYESLFPRLTKRNAFKPDISTTFNDYYLDAFKPNKDYALKFNALMANDTIGNRIYANSSFNYPYVDRKTQRPQTIGYVPLNFETLKKDPKFQMLLDQTREYREFKLSRYASCKFIIKEVVKRIDVEIDQDQK